MKDWFSIIIYGLCFVLVLIAIHTYFDAEEDYQVQEAFWYAGTGLIVAAVLFAGNKISNKKHGNSL